MGEIAALISALAAVAGVLLGFFGLPTVINSPTARNPAPQAPVVTTAPSSPTVETTAPSASPDAESEEPPEEPSEEPSEDPSTAPPPALPSGTVPLSELDPVFGSHSYEIRSVNMGAKLYDQAMVFREYCDSSVEYSINQRYKSFSFVVGLDDNATAESIRFTVKGDGRVRKAVGAEINRPQTVTVDMTDVVKLTIKVEMPDVCDSSGAVPAMANATLHS
ncbi:MULTISPECIES: NPCBM/NEW2 domain-containing protein [unclassified Streptomyces]|uniref:NPCBM/NEW2 domain-containing protein n=1 Tax=unclassified Streptomyces TaxID=2593676 RepID=UPI0036FEF05D